MEVLRFSKSSVFTAKPDQNISSVLHQGHLLLVSLQSLFLWLFSLKKRKEKKMSLTSTETQRHGGQLSEFKQRTLTLYEHLDTTNIVKSEQKKPCAFAET